MWLLPLLATHDADDEPSGAAYPGPYITEANVLSLDGELTAIEILRGFDSRRLNLTAGSPLCFAQNHDFRRFRLQSGPWRTPAKPASAETVDGTYRRA
jgi:hypothetical protein